ncbi:hypothetical protein AAHB37_05145 [Glutamicibacter halophytocola]|uniref:hypothetical protein n=1 Tax=Glutamicibacter halophytocola TaxID=1933880 RepID=UPI0032191538
MSIFAQWSGEKGRVWATSMKAGGRGLPHPVLPDWMNDFLPVHWGNDWTNAPSLAHLWPSAEDWFWLAEQHDDLK